MKKIFLLASLIGLLTSCASTQPLPPQFVVFNYTWKHCTKACGKKNNLAAVSSTDCICTNGDIIPLQTIQPQVIQQPSFFDRFIDFINGE